MKKTFVIVCIMAMVLGCNKNSENLMTVSGSIKGLKKGTLFFQKVQDSTLINIDSLEIKGDGNFVFEYELESPEIFYLYLNKADNNDINDRIVFFGEKGEISINTSWNTFDINATVKGSQSNTELEECKAILSRFGTKELEIAQKIIRPEIQNDSFLLDSLMRLSEKNFVRRYRYVLNYALTHPDSYVSPYLALTEVADANPKYLDSINNSLSPNVANSKYGKALESYVKSLKN